MKQLHSKSIALESRLVDLYPAIFTRATVVPLAIGIHKQIRAEHPEIPADVLSHFMAFWTRRIPYLKALKANGAVRLNLDGSEAGDVSAEDQAFARSRIGGLRLKRIQAVGAATEAPVTA